VFVADAVLADAFSVAVFEVAVADSKDTIIVSHPTFLGSTMQKKVA